MIWGAVLVCEWMIMTIIDVMCNWVWCSFAHLNIGDSWECSFIIYKKNKKCNKLHCISKAMLQNWKKSRKVWPLTDRQMREQLKSDLSWVDYKELTPAWWRCRGFCPVGDGDGDGGGSTQAEASRQHTDAGLCLDGSATHKKDKLFYEGHGNSPDEQTWRKVKRRVALAVVQEKQKQLSWNFTIWETFEPSDLTQRLVVWRIPNFWTMKYICSEKQLFFVFLVPLSPKTTSAIFAVDITTVVILEPIWLVQTDLALM